MNNILIYFIIFLLNFLLLNQFKKLSDVLNLWDHPDNKLKLHKKKAAPIIGVIYFINITLIFMLSFFSQEIFFDKNLFFLLFLFFLLGIYDDYYKINYQSKFFGLIIISFFLLYLDPNLIISELRFSFTDYNVNFDEQYSSYFFTIFCLIVFINAFNMYDGINCQSIIYVCIIFLFLSISLGINYIFLSILITSILFFKKNFVGELFMGNSGTVLMGSLISMTVINLYNLKIIFYADTILILMILPGLDMVRLFYTRIMNKTNPFKGDRRHIHHLLIKKNNLLKSNFILAIIISTPILFSYLNNKLNLIIILLFISIYFIFIRYLIIKK